MSYKKMIDRRIDWTAGFLTLVLVCSLQLSACAKKFEADPAGNDEFRLPSAAGIETRQRKESSLAYEHQMEVELAGELIAARVESVRKACMEDAENGCTLLEISDDERRGVPYGNIKVRIAPNGVDTLTKLASDGGRITSRRTNAEDLAQPIADTERQLFLLNLHRERLTEFMRRKDMKVADLITVSRELATVQAQLDEFDAQRANLRRRIDTDLLTITWRPPVGVFESARTPIRDSFKSFGSNFSDAIAQVIDFFAYALPWAVVLVPGLFLFRWLWRGIGIWLSRRKQTAMGD